MPEFTVAAIRFTDDVDAMRGFLEQLGLATTISSPGWADLRAGRGAVWLHSRGTVAAAQPNGATHLTGMVPDVDDLAERLTKAGLSPVVVDEAFGRSLTVIDPLGAEVLVQEEQDDTYGYDVHDAKPDERLTVAAVRFTDPQGTYGPFLERLGLTPEGHADEHYTAYSDDGQVGLHKEEGADGYTTPTDGADVHLGFTTTEDLDALADRLKAAGHDARITRDEFVSFVEVRDPDGHPIQIHAAG